MTVARDLIQAVIDAGLSVRAVIREPDGRVEILTSEKAPDPQHDLLAAARARREAKGQRNENGH